MKEHTYGWYPSAKNVYEERRMGAPTPYQIEAMYRFRDSKYYQPMITPPEQRTPKPPRPTPSPARRPGSQPCRSDSRASAKSESQSKQLLVRSQSAKIHTLYKPPPKLIIPTPQQCWSTHVPETEVTVQPSQPTPSPAPSKGPEPRSIIPAKPATPQATPVLDATVQEPVDSTSKRISRIQSATVRRDSARKPQRPSKSAGPVRPSPTPSSHVSSVSPLLEPPTYPRPPSMGHGEYSTEQPYDWPSPCEPVPTPPVVTSPPCLDRPASSKRSTSRSSIPSPAHKPPSGKATPLRPKAPSPYKMELHLANDMYDNGRATPDYDERVKKHGWMMEVHGDPLKLKKVSKRLPYTVKVDEPETERDPPGVHMENLETFFLNTIPRRPMAFAIDKEWISEVIHQKRMEMQKKHGLNYRYKNFSFVY